MMLSPSCRVTTIKPSTTLSLLKTRAWLDTDLKYSLPLSKLCHVIIIYQFSGEGVDNQYFFTPMRVTINNAIQKHTVTHPGFSQFIGNFGLWQGSLSSGTHKIVVQYRSSHPATSAPQVWQTRALTIVHCCPP